MNNVAQFDRLATTATADVATQCPDRELEDFSQKLKVCGHPIRLKLLCLIAMQEDSCVSELWVCLNQPQPVVSQHLGVLKEKGIVQSEVQGNKRIYSIVDPFIRSIVDSIQPVVEQMKLAQSTQS